jgi:hypothetical protein
MNIYKKNTIGKYEENSMKTITEMMAIFTGTLLVLVFLSSAMPSSTFSASEEDIATSSDPTNSTHATDAPKNASGRKSLFDRILDSTSDSSDKSDKKNNTDANSDASTVGTNDTSGQNISSTSSDPAGGTVATTSSQNTSSQNTSSQSTSSSLLKKATSTKNNNGKLPGVTTSATTSSNSNAGARPGTTSTTSKPVIGSTDSSGGSTSFTPVIDLKSPGSFSDTLQGLLNPAYADQRKLDPETTNSLLSLSVFFFLLGIGLSTGYFERGFKRLSKNAPIIKGPEMSPDMKSSINVNANPGS